MFSSHDVDDESEGDSLIYSPLKLNQSNASSRHIKKKQYEEPGIADYENQNI